MNNKFVKVLCILVSIIYIGSVNIYADDSDISNKTIEFEDENLFNELLSYDRDKNGKISVEEAESIIQLGISGVQIKSMKGIENLVNLEYLVVYDCGIDSLDYIRELTALKILSLDNNNITEIGDISGMNLEEISLKNNNISDLDEFIRLMDADVKGFYISGNPVYDEAKEYYFYNCDTKLSIIGKPGDVVYQKYDSGELNVDEYKNPIYNNDLLTDLEFEIEDTEIAKLGEKKIFYRVTWNGVHNIKLGDEETIKGDDILSGAIKDDIQLVELIAEGKTRMKITCEDWVKYTDIWVTSDIKGDALMLEIDEISDKSLFSIFRNLSTTESGYIKQGKIAAISEAQINGTYAVIDFTSLKYMDRLVSLTLKNYNQDMINNMKGLGVAESIKQLNIVDSEIGNLVLEEANNSIKRLDARNNGITYVNVDMGLPIVESINLKNNQISNVEDIVIPKGVKYLYLAGNPLPVEADIDLFDKYMFVENISGKVGDKYRSMHIDCISEDEIVYSIENSEIAVASDDTINLLSAGTTTLRVSYKGVEKTIEISVEAGDIKGDIDMDGLVNAKDALLALKNAAKIIELTDAELEIGDVNKDGAVDAEDALEILKQAAKII